MFKTLWSFILCILFVPLALQAQNSHSMYWVAFKDKRSTPYRVDAPQQYLSDRAIERRARYNIPITPQDFPVNPAYIYNLSKLVNSVSYTSKWLNGAVVEIQDKKAVKQIQRMPYIKKVVPISKTNSNRKTSQEKFRTKKIPDAVNDFDGFYGTAAHQIKMLEGETLHHAGYRGKGMRVAIMDGGFINVDQLEVFRRLFENGQILDTHDFVDGDKHVYAHGTHGTNVFSIMGGYIPGVYVGAAPEAEYLLFRTENGASETPLEEFNWIAAIEYSDSAGVDVVNTSLGYSVYDDETMSYTYRDMDGETAYITQAVDIASGKGMLIATSAGNKGDSKWNYITAPADADSSLTVGSVTSRRRFSSFSSHGPTFDKRIKPNICGQGTATAYVNMFDKRSRGNGTSYSTPLVAGLTACLWQANRSLPPQAIIRAIEQSGSNAQTPDADVGYGIANFQAANELLNPQSAKMLSQHITGFSFEHTIDQQLFYYESKQSGSLVIEVKDLYGKVVERQQRSVEKGVEYIFTFKKNYPAGFYHVLVYNDKGLRNTVEMVN